MRASAIQDPRTRRNTGGSSPSGDGGMAQYEQFQVLGLGAFGPRRLGAMGPPFAVIQVTKGEPVIVRFGPDFDGKRDNFDDVLAYAAGKGLMGSKEALDTRGGVINIGRDNPRERVRHRNAIAVNHRRPVVGQHTDMSRDVSATGARSRGNIHIPGAHVNLDARGYGGSFSGNFTANNAKMGGAAISVKHGSPQLFDPIGSFKVGGKDVHAMGWTAALKATDPIIKPTDPLSNFSMPSIHDVQRAATSHITLGAPHAVRASLARNAAAAVHDATPFHSHVAPKRERNLDAGPGF